MPAFTPLRQYPFPVDTDLQNVASAIEALARAVDNVDGTETIRRYPSVAARDSVNPTPQEGQRCYCVVGSGAGNGMQFVGRGGQWWALGMSLFAARAGVLSVPADGTWTVIPWTVNYFDVGNRLGGAGTWTAPFKGFARVYAGATVVIGAGGVAQIGNFHAALGIGYIGTVQGGEAFLGSFSQISLRASSVLSVNPGDQVSIQANISAAGATKTLHFAGGDVVGFTIEYV